MGPLVRLVDASTRLARRRARYMATVFGALGTCVVVLCDLLPAEHQARAVVAPSGPGRTGPIERVRELALSPASLADVASAASVAESRTLGEWVAGRSPEAGLRVSPEVLVVRGGEREVEHVVVLARGLTAPQARLAADALADRVVAQDASLATGVPLDRASAPPSTAARARLEAHRARLGPLLRDLGLEERHRALAVRVAEERAALVGLRAQLVGAGEETDRLEELARDEAARAHALHRDEEAARAALAAVPAPAPAPAPQSATPTPADRLSALEAELQRLLVTFTERHPEVRRAQRQVEAERRAQAAAPRAPGAAQEAAGPRRPQVADAPPAVASLVFTVADDDAPPPAPGPEAWLPRAPSYGLWAAARARAETTRVEVEAREQALAVRTGELATLERSLAEQAAARAEESRLAADAAAELALLPPAPLEPTARLAVVERATVVDSRSPWALLLPGLLLAGLASMALGVAVDAADRTLHRREELEALGVTVLGVIPRVGR
jgi:hypothetical protein